MATIRNGPNNPTGFNFSPEFMDFTCAITLANGATLAQGQVVCRAPAVTPSSTGADMVVLPNVSNAGDVYGVYQGPAITNSTGSSQTYAIEVRQFGYGVVLAGTVATSGTAVTVDGALITSTSKGFAVQGSAALNAYVGKAAPTGTATAHGATIIAVAGTDTTQLINAYIDCK